MASISLRRTGVWPVQYVGRPGIDDHDHLNLLSQLLQPAGHAVRNPAGNAPARQSIGSRRLDFANQSNIEINHLLKTGRSHRRGILLQRLDRVYGLTRTQFCGQRAKDHALRNHKYRTACPHRLNRDDTRVVLPGAVRSSIRCWIRH